MFIFRPIAERSSAPDHSWVEVFRISRLVEAKAHKLGRVAQREGVVLAESDGAREKAEGRAEGRRLLRHADVALVTCNS